MKSLNLVKSNQNQIFYYTRCSTPKRVTSWRGPSPRHCARATQLLSKKCCSGGGPLATLCPIWPARDLNLWPPAPEPNALPLDFVNQWKTWLECFFNGFKARIFLFDFVSRNAKRSNVNYLRSPTTLLRICALILSLGKCFMVISGLRNAPR